MRSRLLAPPRRAALLLALTVALSIAVSIALSVAMSVAISVALPGTARAGEAAPVVADAALEARVLAIASELRCLVCQNQTIADSHAGLAVDLRQQIREMLGKGMSERDVLDYMTQRYGDFVLYRPPLRTTTALLWAGPAVLLLGGVAGLVLLLRRRQRMAPEAFDADLSEAADFDAPEPYSATATPPGRSAHGAARTRR